MTVMEIVRRLRDIAREQGHDEEDELALQAAADTLEELASITAKANRHHLGMGY